MVLLQESHSEDVLFHWPDGRTTNAIERHTEDPEKMFVYAPDFRIKEYSIEPALEIYQQSLRIMEGTFTGRMPVGEGKFNEPSNKAFKINMVTIDI